MWRTVFMADRARKTEPLGMNPSHCEFATDRFRR